MKKLAINCSRTFDITKCVDVDVDAACADVEYGRLLLYSLVEVGQLLPPLFYFICFAAPRRWWRAVTFFTEPHVRASVCVYMCVFVYARLQLLFQRKFANDSPLSVLAFRLPHIARRFFFCPTLTGRASVRASRFLCPDPGVDKVYGHG